MKKVYLVIFLFFTIKSFSQISFRAEFDSIFTYDLWQHSSQIVRCADGGFALSNSTAYGGGGLLAGYIIKTDSNGTIEWSKLYPNQLSNGVMNTTQLIATSDSGFYFEIEPLDIVYNDYAFCEIMKLDKYGNVRASKHTSFYGQPDGNMIRFKEVEKNTNNLYVVGDIYGYDPFNDEPCCDQYYFAKLDTSLTVQFSKQIWDWGNATATEIYIGGNPEGLLLGGADWRAGGNYRTSSIIKWDTAGNMLWQKYYTDDNYPYGRFVENIVQVDSNFYVLEWPLQLRKIDFDGNTIFYEILDSTYTYPIIENLKIALEDSAHLLITGLFGFSSNILLYTLMIETDMSGNVTQAKTGIDSLYYYANIDTFSKAILFIRNVTDSVFQFEKEFINNPSCNFVPVSLTGFTGIIQDSTAFPTTTPFGPVLYNDTILPSALAPGVTILCTGTTGINNKDKEPAVTFRIYPNPAKSTFTLQLPLLLKNVHIEIYNVMGKKVYEENIFNSSSKEIHLKNISSGIYFVKILDEEKQCCKKIILQDN